MDRHPHSPLPSVLLLACCLSLAAATAQAQPSASPSAPADFPAGAAAPTADALREHLTGKVFHVRPATGASWRLQYNPNGWYYVNTSSGLRDSGQWRTEDGKLCTSGSSAPAACNEVRMGSDGMYLKRTSGEVVRFETQ